MSIGVALQNRNARVHLGEYAAHTPEVDRRSVEALAEQQLWWPVPACDDHVGKLGTKVSPVLRQIFRIERPRETEVGDDQPSRPFDE